MIYMMNKKIYEMHADLCKVFTSPVRVELIDILRHEKKSVNELVDLMGLSQSNISQHLHILRERGVVRTEKEGKFVYYTLTNLKISEAFSLMKDILEVQLAESEKLYKTIARK